MDKNKQFTETVHPIGATIDPAPSVAMPASAVTGVKKFSFSDKDLSSDFTNSVDPNAEPETVEVAEAPALAEPPQTSTHTETAAPSPSKPPKTGVTGIKRLVKNRYILLGAGSALLLLLIVGGVLYGRHMKPPSQVINDSSKLDQSTLYIDSSKHTVGVKTDTNPDGLQVGSTVTTTPQGAANIRLGLVNGTDPSILFEDNQKNSWQVLGAGGSLQFIQGTTTRAKLDDKALTLTNALNVGSDLNVTGNVRLGNDSGNLVTIQASNVATPNNLNFSNNVLVIEASKGSVAIGANTASGYKLLVAGTLKVNGNITADGQVLAAAGTAKNPGLTFNNNSNTGIYEPSLNTVGVAAGGTQVLQVQQGSVYTVNGANIEADGYLRGGRASSNPDFQVMRFTGTLDGSGSATINDGLGNGQSRVLNVDAFYKGNSNEAVSLNVDSVNNSSVQISGGIPGRQYRVSIIYSSDGAGW
jgi:hypothetical protein